MNNHTDFDDGNNVLPGRAKANKSNPQPKTIIAKLAETIAERREELGYTQEQLGDKLAITQAQWSYIENGKTKPNIEDILEIAKALDINPFVLLRRALDKVEFNNKPHMVLSVDDFENVIDLMEDEAKKKRHEMIDRTIKDFDSFKN